MESEPLSNGTKVRDTIFQKEGEITDHACQYAHPQAKPVYHYLVKWEDGMFQSFASSAFGRGHGLELVDSKEAR